MGEIILKMQGIQKYFPGVHALDDAQLEIRSGEVMGLIGENGAGKSTLMKILTGIYPKDGGTIEFFGEQIEINGPKDAQNRGICIVHQELNLMQHLTVADNIFIGRESTKGLFLDKAEQNRRTQELLDSLHLTIDPKAEVRTLSVAKQQMVEIAKALSFNNTKILILDEPSAVLTDTEIDDLFTFVNQLKETGVGIIYISHRMDELKRITDRITVMRDGQYVGIRETAVTEIAEIVRMMVGRTIYEEPKTCSAVPADAPVILECEHLNSWQVKDVSFKLKKGEILGFSGLMGAGRTETMRLLCGADPMDSGVIKLNGKEVKIDHPRKAIKAGIGLVTENRREEGLMLKGSLKWNISMTNLKAIMGFANCLSPKKEKAYAEKGMQIFRVKATGYDMLAGGLSGGNQQKVVLAKWMLTEPDVLILDEPTRGIDVGAKYEIYLLMNKLVEAGKSIIMISSELPEVLGMSDRVLVMHGGQIKGELTGENMTAEKVMKLAID